MYMYVAAPLDIHCKLDAKSRELRDLESRGPWAVVFQTTTDLELAHTP